MEKNNHFSVIIPLYNKVEYIERAIKSVLAQTYPYFEIIIVNDGSIDESVIKVKSFTDDRIKLINQKNQGVSTARNNGAKNSKYKYLAFLDADDVWHETFLENVNLLIEEYPDSGIFGTNNYFKYPTGKLFFENFDWLFHGKKTGIIDDYFALFAKMKKSPFSNSNICIPLKIYNEFNGYKENVRLTEDSDLWCRIALKYDLAYIIIPLATYYLALPESTHLAFESNDYEIVSTLRNALTEKRVKLEQIQSINKLIALQHLNLIKRSILTGHKLFALNKMFHFSLFYHYPLSIIYCFVSLLIPKSIFQLL